MYCLRRREGSNHHATCLSHLLPLGSSTLCSTSVSTWSSPPGSTLSVAAGSCQPPPAPALHLSGLLLRSCKRWPWLVSLARPVPVGTMRLICCCNQSATLDTFQHAGSRSMAKLRRMSGRQSGALQ